MNSLSDVNSSQPRALACVSIDERSRIDLTAMYSLSRTGMTWHAPSMQLAGPSSGCSCMRLNMPPQPGRSRAIARVVSTHSSGSSSMYARLSRSTSAAKSSRSCSGKRFNRSRMPCAALRACARQGAKPRSSSWAKKKRKPFSRLGASHLASPRSRKGAPSSAIALLARVRGSSGASDETRSPGDMNLPFSSTESRASAQSMSCSASHGLWCTKFSMMAWCESRSDAS